MTFREREIPNLDEQRRKVSRTYSTKIDQKHDLFCENVIDIRTLGLSGENYYFKEHNPPYYARIQGSIKELFLRKSVAERLVTVNNRLLNCGLELYIFDCYRPVEVQSFLYEKWYPKYLRKLYPKLSESDILLKRDKYVAKAFLSNEEINMNAPPPHSTAAAIDLTLRIKESGEHLFMGSIYDEVTEIVHTDYFENLHKHSTLSLSEEEALKNRRMLYWSMKDEGFENYPDEWWHYSYGDQMWSTLNENKNAYYSFINPNN